MNIYTHSTKLTGIVSELASYDALVHRLNNGETASIIRGGVEYNVSFDASNMLKIDTLLDGEPTPVFDHDVICAIACLKNRTTLMLNGEHEGVKISLLKAMVRPVGWSMAVVIGAGVLIAAINTYSKD